jgi:hypothetical protein
MWWLDYNNENIKKMCSEYLNRGEVVDYSERMRNWFDDNHDKEWIYMLNVGENYYKIGKTSKLNDRLRTFRASNAFVSHSNNVVAIFAGSDIGKKEKSIHKWIRGHRKNVDETYKSELCKLGLKDIQSLFDYMSIDLELRIAPRDITEVFINNKVKLCYGSTNGYRSYSNYKGRPNKILDYGYGLEVKEPNTNLFCENRINTVAKRA